MVERENVPLFHGKSILKGFLAGSLILGGIINPYGFAVQTVLFIIGLLVFIESVMSVGEATYIVTVFSSTIIGAVAYYILFLMGLQLHYIILIIVLAVLAYLKAIYSSIR